MKIKRAKLFKSGRKHLHIILDSDIHDKLFQKSEEIGMSASSLARMIFRKYFKLDK